MVTLPEATEVEAENLNNSLLTLYPVRRRRRQPTPCIPQVADPPEPAQFYDNETALKQIHTRNIKITWTSHVELHQLDQLILTTYLRSLKHFNQSIWTGTFLVCQTKRSSIKS